MKRWSILGICLLLLGLTACGGKDDAGSDTTGKESRQLGLAAVSSMDVAGGDMSKVKSTVAAVMLDEKGVILQCRIEETAFDVTLKNGMAQEVMDTVLMGKWERGDQYTLTDEERGDGTATGSWKDQVDAFCRFVVGKTPDQVSSIAATDGRSTEIAGCNLVITDFIQAVHKAGKAAKKVNAASGDALHLAMSANRSKDSSDASPQFDVEVAAVTVDGKGVVTGCITDTLETKLTIKEGLFAMTSGDITTKRQMADSYGMKGASPIKKEWYQQADALDTYVVGKTADALRGIKTDANGKVDSISGCTIAVSGMLKNVIKAAEMTDTAG